MAPGPRAVQAPHDVEQPQAKTGSAATGNAKGPPYSSWLLGGPSRGGSAGIRTQGGYEPHRLSRSAPSAARTRYLTRILYYTLPLRAQIDRAGWEQGHIAAWEQGPTRSHDSIRNRRHLTI